MAVLEAAGKAVRLSLALVLSVICILICHLHTVESYKVSNTFRHNVTYYVRLMSYKVIYTSIIHYT